MRDPRTIPVVAVEFQTDGQGVLRKSWTMDEMAGDPFNASLRDGIPDWLANPSKSWPHPQDPITYKGTVKPGREDEARAALGLASHREGTGAGE